jgi:hypothetical protein
MRSGMRFSVLAEVDASSLFDGESTNWKYCIARATFVHRDEDACEFIRMTQPCPVAT